MVVILEVRLVITDVLKCCLAVLTRLKMSTNHYITLLSSHLLRDGDELVEGIDMSRFRVRFAQSRKSPTGPVEQITKIVHHTERITNWIRVCGGFW